MRTFMRTATRRAAVGLGTLALAAGATACSDGGGEESPDSGGTGLEQPAEEDQGSDGGGDEGSDDGGGDDGATAPFSDEDLTSATERFIEFLQVVDDSDVEGACGFVLDPSTGAPPTGAALDECTATLEESLAGFEDQLRPGMFDAMDGSMLEATDNGDGTVAITLPDGSEFPLPMVEGADGAWYLSAA